MIMTFPARHAGGASACLDENVMIIARLGVDLAEPTS
jgi:hypothetical protein